MPIYRFQVETRLAPSAAIARLKALTGPPRSFWSGYTFGPDDSFPPFIGKVAEKSFRLRRDIHYRNSFLPLIWGRATVLPDGSRIRVTMFLHPFMTIFMALWLYGIGTLVVEFLSNPPPTHRWAAVGPASLLVFGIALVCGGFFPEAIKARRLLEQALSRSSA